MEKDRFQFTLDDSIDAARRRCLDAVEGLGWGVRDDLTQEYQIFCYVPIADLLPRAPIYSITLYPDERLTHVVLVAASDDLSQAHAGSDLPKLKTAIITGNPPRAAFAPSTQVFISHSSQDDEFVTRLAANLRAAGVEPWVDHDDILPGADWDRSVETALDACDAMILVLTPRSVDSKNVKVEWSYFLDLEKPIYPIVAKKVDKVPFRLRLHQQVDFTRGGKQALANLLKALGVSPPEGAVHELPRQKPAGFERLPFEPETILIPAGPFLMGSDREKDPDADDSELPHHIVTLSDYKIGKYPVTVGEYRVFIEEGGYWEKHYWTEAGWPCDWKQPFLWDNPKWTGDDRLPVVGVSWFEAYAYCQFLAVKTGRFYRLPSESEWEKAARGVDGRIYPWGNDWQDGFCNAQGSEAGGTTLIGFYSPSGDSPYGAADMSGNVWEWCQSLWSRNYRDPEDNDPQGDMGRVLRGGSWHHDRISARVARRIGNPPANRYEDFGFRVAMSVK